MIAPAIATISASSSPSALPNCGARTSPAESWVRWNTTVSGSGVSNAPIAGYFPRRTEVTPGDGRGQAFLKRYPFERYARDARAAALMRPWTEEIATQQAWEAALGLDGPRGGGAGA